MKIPGLTDLAKDVGRIADALTKLAEYAEVLAEKAVAEEEYAEASRKLLLVEKNRND